MHPDRPIAPRSSSATITTGAGETLRGPDEARAYPTPTARLGGAYTCFDTLGVGGSAVVRRAHQAVLDREVAVKTPLRGASSPATVARVLQEAWVTGALEHPGVVPVHDVVVDDDGCPHIVMRRIAGWTWTELLNDPARIEREFGARDLLGWHLRVLMAVAATVHHAHGLGVLHRDLKPDNVMIGPGGEPYVLDWGIAVALDERAAHRLPRASEQSALAGTPHYMAPEMARGDGASLGVPTDVYLLGGLLYAVLTHRVPHPGEELETVVRAAAEVTPAPPEGPPRLAALATEALRADPAERPPTAEHFRRTIQGYLEERDADALVEAGHGALADLRAACAIPGEPNAPDAAVYGAFSAARLAFEQALVRLPGHPEATAALRAARLLIVERELARGAADAASRALAEVSDPPEALARAVQRAVADEARRSAASSRLLADHDAGAGIRTRSFVSLIVGGTFTLAPLYAAVAHRDASMAELLGAFSGLLCFVLGLGVWARDSLGRSLLNRAVIRTTAAAPLVEIVLLLGADRLGLGPETVVIFVNLVGGALCIALAATVEPWMLVPGVAYLGAFLTAATVPALRWEILSASNVVLACVALARWGPEGLRSWVELRAARRRA